MTDLARQADVVRALVEGDELDFRGVEGLTLNDVALAVQRGAAPVIVLERDQLSRLYAEGQQRVRWEEPREFWPNFPDAPHLFGRRVRVAPTEEDR